LSTTLPDLTGYSGQRPGVTLIFERRLRVGHSAIQEQLDGTAIDWLEHVSGEQYQAR